LFRASLVNTKFLELRWNSAEFLFLGSTASPWLAGICAERSEVRQNQAGTKREEVAASAHRRMTLEMTASGAARDGWLSTGINGSAGEVERGG
jgi:hypothetical protein